MTTLRYKILLRKEDDGTYTVIVPSLPGCLTFGHTVEEALEMAKESIEGFIECMDVRCEVVLRSMPESIFIKIKRHDSLEKGFQLLLAWDCSKLGSVGIPQLLSLGEGCAGFCFLA